MRRPSGVATTIILAGLVITACGSTQQPGTGPVTDTDVTAIAALMQMRASAMGRGDLTSFLATIDPTRPTLRRTQQEEFADPNGRSSITRSTFKVTTATRYLGYIQAFVEEAVGISGYAGAVADPTANVRRYFRKDGDRWLLSEPTTDELGGEHRRTVGDVDLTYWGVDEDLANLYVTEAQAAHDFGVRSSPAQVAFNYAISIVPTAAVAGPGWSYNTEWTGSVKGGTRFFPGAWALDAKRSQLSPFTRSLLKMVAADTVREILLPGIGGRLGNHQWLRDGPRQYAAGIDQLLTMRQSCAGVQPPTLAQLNEGPPDPSVATVSSEVYVRFYAHAASLVTYLIETYGTDKYWGLMRAISESGVGPTTFVSALGIPEEGLYAAWLRWLPKKYC